MKAAKKKSKVISAGISTDPKKKKKTDPMFKKPAPKSKGKETPKAKPEPEPVAEQPVKRGRGRPRTRPLPDPNAPKRPRGRPRTKPLPTPEELKAKEKRRKERERKQLQKALEEGHYVPVQLSPGTGKKTIGPQAFSVSSEMLALTEPKGSNKRGKKANGNLQKRFENTMTAFQQEFADLKKLYGADADDFQNDKSTLAMLRGSLAMTLDLVPIAERTYRNAPSHFNMNALVNLTNQARELANDIRNLQSLEQQIDHINREIIIPSIRMMGQDLISLTHTLKKEASFYLKKATARRIMHAHIDEMARNHGKYMTQVALDMQEKVRKYLTE